MIAVDAASSLVFHRLSLLAHSMSLSSLSLSLALLPAPAARYIFSPLVVVLLYGSANYQPGFVLILHVLLLFLFVALIVNWRRREEDC